MSPTSDLLLRRSPPKIDEPRILSLEEALAFVAEDELVEITPKSIRLAEGGAGQERETLRLA